MSTTISEVLAELADQAEFYPQPEVIVSAARRRMRRRLAVPVAAGLALALAVIVVTGLRLPARAPTTTNRIPDDTVPSGTPLRVADLRLPAITAPPAGGAPVLPTDAGVGRAALVYQTCWNCVPYLMLPGGQQYRLDLAQLTQFTTDRPLGGPPQWLPVNLSPDGRWLAVATRNDFLVRDLDGTQVRSYPIWAIDAWSANGRYAVAIPRQSNVASALSIIDLATGAMRGLQSTGVDLVTDAGEHLAVVDDGAGGSLQVFAGDAAPGAQPALAQFSAVVAPGQTIEPSWHLVGIDGADQGSATAGRFVAGPGANFLALVYLRTSATVTVDRNGGYVLPPLVEVGAVAIHLPDATVHRVDLPPHAGMPALVGSDLVAPVQATTDDPIRLVLGGSEHELTLTQLGPQAIYVLPGMGEATEGPAWVSY